VVVVFSILVQGLTIGPLLRRTVGRAAEDAAD
jgi:NhaP-type Na+/H+ or K+/H+ antiporter